MKHHSGGARRALIMAALCLAGGIIYGLPYLRQSYHEPLRQALDATNTELGFLSSMFGILALACYFPGGWLADRFSARKLLTVSMFGTGMGGLGFAMLPAFSWVVAIHAFWGISTILTFWAALIRATREWGGDAEQGRAFGLLEGGRGLVEALVASLALQVFAAYADQVAGLKGVITVYAVAAFVVGAMVWVLIPDVEPDGGPSHETPREELIAVLTSFEPWLISLVILCAYAGWWGSFDFVAYAVDGYGQTAEEAATLGTFRLWIRPFAAVGAGLLADRFSVHRSLVGGFVSLLAGYTTLAVLPPNGWVLLWAQTAIVSGASFALRGIYHALLEESRIPAHRTGLVVGLASVLGYTPDVFQGLLAGAIVDAYPGALGHRIYFGLLAGVAGLGLVAVTVLVRAVIRHQGKAAVVEG